jgi:predicted  nucleic acid-binding Zn-ribbon protein
MSRRRHEMTKRRTNVNRAMEELNDYLKEIAAAKRQLQELDQEWQTLLSRYKRNSEGPGSQPVADIICNR